MLCLKSTRSVQDVDKNRNVHGMYMCVCVCVCVFCWVFCVVGEMLVGPSAALFMDEISTGLDSSTTFQIINCLSQIVHVLEGTILVSLLQPAPETFQLFDDIILLSEGVVVYQGPCNKVEEFFDSCGFKCPPRKGIADFLQEVTLTFIIY